jgi:aminopeptidase N
MPSAAPLAGRAVAAPADQPCAQQRRRPGVVEAPGQREAIARIGDRVGRMAAIAGVAREQRRVAEVLAIGAAIRARTAGGAEPRHADALAEREARDACTQRRDLADDLVTRHDRRLGMRQLTAIHVQIGAAQAASGDRDQDFARSRFCTGRSRMTRGWPGRSSTMVCIVFIVILRTVAQVERKRNPGSTHHCQSQYPSLQIVGLAPDCASLHPGYIRSSRPPHAGTQSMRTEQAVPVRLADYRPPDWLVETVDLDVSLDATKTLVRARLKLKPNPQAAAPTPVVLDGDELQLRSVKLDGAALSADAYVATADGLTILQPPPRAFVLETETELDPSANTKLMGLYRSGKAYTTQCEAEGFRRITYFPDRPDVMAVYTTRIEADKAEAPVLLANGNLTAAGDIEGPSGTTRHFAVWHDPFPKPSYLFALVGGVLGVVEDAFITMSGREVALKIFVEPGKEARADYAMGALKRAMRWDEQAFGREYDLDIFMIVAVSHFNMGAMENKGLNIFNDKNVLASQETATDQDFNSVEAIIAHEYFHNWTGNRITCRDWFQLCLKEGLTVFRDQEFTSDIRSRPVKRIADVRALRGHQFVEDAGPLAHSVRPEVYREISNFYTSTIYEKGAEVVRMLKTLLGPERFRAGMDLYFARHDGHAATVDEFIACFADAAKYDLTQFMLWYRQAGTPELMVQGNHDAGAKTYTLEISQIVPPTPGQPDKEPMTVPFAVGFLGPDGKDRPLTLADGRKLTRGVLTLTKAKESFVFAGLDERPVVSLNRSFSAAVKLTANLRDSDLAFLAAHDSDPFNRWQAVQTLATVLLVENVAAHRADTPKRAADELVRALSAILEDHSLEPAFVAQALTLPSEGDIAREIGRDVDPDAIFLARRELRAEVGRKLTALGYTYRRMMDLGPFSPDAASAGRRALKNVCLDLLATAEPASGIARAAAQYRDADNMTDRIAALATLSHHQVPERQAAFDDFYRRYDGDALIIDKWFGLQAAIPEADTMARVKGLAAHPAFSMSNPNRVRALIGNFAQGNQTQFNRADGEGYAFHADTMLALDAINPQVAARLMTAFRSWRALEPGRRDKAEAALKRVAAATLSRDVHDIVVRTLGTS